MSFTAMSKFSQKNAIYKHKTDLGKTKIIH